jgi:hypothetical protein
MRKLCKLNLKVAISAILDVDSWLCELPHTFVFVPL